MTPSDVAAFANFMRFLDQPQPACTGTDARDRFRLGACSSGDWLRELPYPLADYGLIRTADGLSNVQANLFSDLALHHMGSNLADGISQGNAGPDQFRTAPLWGLGQRVFFLHDGRTSNLGRAILDHEGSGSESNRVVENYEQLSTQNKQNLILFLRSL